MKTLGKITLVLYLALFSFSLGKFTYYTTDGFGFFIPGLGGYHLSTLGESKQ
jgi:hypothetical protein